MNVPRPALERDPRVPGRAPLPGSVADPSRDIRIGALVAALFFVGFLGWAAFARLDAAVTARGTLIVSGQRQSVQHRDGGVVGEILVHEGQRVRAGQLLVRLAAADVRAQERSLSSQAIRLLAQRARLEAEQVGAPHVMPPPEYATVLPADRAYATAALRLQQAELDARTAVLAAQRGALEQQAAQSGEQGRGYSGQLGAAKEELRLLDQELGALQPLVAKGFVSQTRVRQLERQRAELVGQRGQYGASIMQTRNAARESDLRALEARKTFQERAASDLRDVESRLGDILPRLTAARDQLARTEIRAPATGPVVGLSVFTPGGVVAAGQKLMEIVPERAPLVVQARIAPDDVDDLWVGQPALVRFSGFHDRSIPHLEGTLTRLSADSFADEKTGQNYFSAEITVLPGKLRVLRERRDAAFKLRSGTPVEIMIRLHPRTALQYVLEPLTSMFWPALHEH